ncbi:MarR family winged helix-turn-helix transcriptional regulator [Nonomuraea typhae]|uniref:MarR family winged helix-turn-helix transcriptional regulator n=1 Tax=Nonomuraea typhae TaxID=2603600 RepID=A0ABW7YX41_9ACTN
MRKNEDRLIEVFDLVGPLYRRAQRKVERDIPLEVGIRAILTMLRHGPMTVPQMGRAQALSRQFVQRTTNDAAARGLVEPIPNPAHKRSSLIRLTDKGQRAVDEVVALERSMLREPGADLTEADLIACVRVLTRLLRHLDDVDVD